MDGTMKKLSVFLFIFILLISSGCTAGSENYDIVATTLPVYDFTAAICEGTDLTVGRLVTESVSCLHDYSLQVSQMRMIESADMIVISGAGLEGFLEDALSGSRQIIDASVNAHMHTGGHHHDGDDHHAHDHEQDPHIWLSTENAAVMASNICDQLCNTYPQYQSLFRENLTALQQKLIDLQSYGDEQLQRLRNRELITFHDGFAYFAESFNLEILEAIEEESGSEASAAEIIHLVNLIQAHQLPAVFTEVNGSVSAASVICAETGVVAYSLDMAMSGNSYFDAMYRNIDTLKEALG